MSDQELKQMLQALMEAVQINTAEIRGLKDRVGSLEARMDTMEANMATLAANMATLATNMSIMQADIATMKANMVTMQADIATMQATMVTKADFAAYVEYADRTFAKKEDLAVFATKADLLAMEDRLLHKIYAHEFDIQRLKQNFR